MRVTHVAACVLTLGLLLPLVFTGCTGNSTPVAKPDPADADRDPPPDPSRDPGGDPATDPPETEPQSPAEPEKPSDMPAATAALTAAQAVLQYNADKLVVGVKIPKSASGEQAAAVLSELRGLPALRFLNIEGRELTDEQLGQVGSLKQLESLRLFDVRLSAPALKHLADLQQLRTLSLGSTDISDDTVTYLSKLPRLEQLDLQWTDITGTGLEQLAGLDSLVQLDLAWTAVADEQVPQLTKLKQLERLVIEGTDLSDSGIRQLKAALTDTAIVAEDIVAEAVRRGPKPDPNVDGGGPFRDIVGQYQAAHNEFMQKYRAAGNDGQRREAAKSAPPPKSYAERLLTFAQESPEHPAAIDALAWILETYGEEMEELQESATDLLVERHLEDKRLTIVCNQLAFTTTPAAGTALREVLAKSEDREVKGVAAYALGRHLRRTALAARRVRQMNETALIELTDLQGQSLVDRLIEADPDPLEKDAEESLRRVAREFADVRLNDVPLRDLIDRELFELKDLAVGQVAPDIEGEDIAGEPFRLSDYRGKVVLLTFWGHW